MRREHSPNWIEASRLLREAMEQYRDEQQCSSLAKVVDDLIDYIEHHSGKWLNEKTIQRDFGNKNESKKLYAIPAWRVKIYTQWLYEELGRDQEWIVTWLDATAYSSPGKLLAELGRTDENIHKMSSAVKTNVPPLKNRLWGRFLGRHEEMERLRQWADQQRHPIAVLYGFGGNGKTSIQQKAGEEFIHGVKCPLRWPYAGAIWVSAVDYSEGQLNLLDVLREIAKTFDLYGDYTQEDLGLIPPDVMQKDVIELFEKKRILILLDNFETVKKPDQVEILQFFNNLRGASQALISTRYRPDWFLEEERDEMYSMAYVLIRVDGLSAEDAERLVYDFLKAKSLPRDEFDPQDIKHLTTVTRNNPKTLLALLGLVEQGIPLPHLLTALTSGTSEADQIYDKVIDRAWEEILTEADKAMLMAKALFPHSVSETNLGRVAGVAGHLLRETTKKLAAISFFEFERKRQQPLRIRTHPLAQDFALRVLRDHPEFEREAEARWWNEYAPHVVQKIGEATYESQRLVLEDDVANVIAYLEHHIHQRSPYLEQAARLFGGRGGLGYTLLWWGRYDDVLRIAEPVLEFAISQQDIRLIGECALRLIAVIHIKHRRFDDVDRYIGLIIDQNASFHDPWLELILDSVRAFLYHQRGFLRAAEQFCQNALKLSLELESTFDIAVAYRVLGSLTIDLAVQNLEEAIDGADRIHAELAAAEEYLEQAETYLAQEREDRGVQFNRNTVRVHRAIIARLRGDLNQARDLFQTCSGRFQSTYSVANLYRELALVEHLAGNRELARSYEEKGLNLFKQLGMLNILPPSHCSRVIERMKQDGTW